MKTSLVCLTISLWLQMKSLNFNVTEPRLYFTQGTTLLNLPYNGPQTPPPTYSMMESSGGFLSFDSSFLHDWTPASWCWGSALITFCRCGTRGQTDDATYRHVRSECVKHVTLSSECSLVVHCLAQDYYVSHS